MASEKMQTLVLASSSQSRKALLKRLGLDFKTHPSDVDETPQQNESVVALVERLSTAKAQAAAPHYPAAWIIGSDQSAFINDCFLTKPKTTDKAVAQLLHCSGKTVVFHAAVCLLNAKCGDSSTQSISTEARFRKLSKNEIQRYVEHDMPLSCAGSFRSEALGISLFESIYSNDPTALMGMPLICLSQMLRTAGFHIP